MALTFTSGDSLSRTASLPSFPCTMMGWFKLTADNGAANNALAFGDSTGSLYVQIGANMATNVFFVWNGDVTVTGIAAATGTWYHLCLVIRDPAGAGTADDAQGYINAANNINCANTLDSVSAEKLWVGNDNDAEYWSGDVAAIKVWSGYELTVAEIQTEMLQYCPVRQANLYAYWPLLNVAEQATDYYTGGLSWTVGGTLATAEGPPIPWRKRRRRQVFPSSAAAASAPTRWTVGPNVGTTTRWLVGPNVTTNGPP